MPLHQRLLGELLFYGLNLQGKLGFVLNTFFEISSNQHPLMPMYRYRAELELYPAMRRSRESLADFSPILSADIIEGLDDFHVYVDLPGVHMDDLDITIKDGRLNICAERRQVHKVDDIINQKTERSFGKVKRSLVIPRGAVESTADAKFVNGVLSVRFQKSSDYIAGRKLTVM